MIIKLNITCTQTFKFKYRLYTNIDLNNKNCSIILDKLINVSFLFAHNDINSVFLVNKYHVLKNKYLNI